MYKKGEKEGDNVCVCKEREEPSTHIVSLLNEVAQMPVTKKAFI